jgi:hypothetical protein
VDDGQREEETDADPCARAAPEFMGSQAEVLYESAV